MKNGQGRFKGMLGRMPTFLLEFSYQHDYDIYHIDDMDAFEDAAYEEMPEHLRAGRDDAQRQVTKQDIRRCLKEDLGIRREDPLPLSARGKAIPVRGICPEQLEFDAMRSWCLGQVRYTMLPCRNVIARVAQEWASNHPDRNLNVDHFVGGVLREAGL